MTYYDEFGITALANPEQIRKAHHALSRLLHPDLQSDPELRQMAEIQMRRLNEMAATLLDPLRRRAYDQGLAAVPIPAEPPVQLARKRGILLFPSIVVSGVALTATTLYLVPGDLFHIANSPPYSFQPPAPEPDQALVTGILRKPETAKLPPAAPPPYEGLWVYVASHKRGPARLAEPERIELRISNDRGLLHGLYRTRSSLLTFMGPATGRATSLTLRAPDGAEGNIDLRIAGPNVLHVDWAVKPVLAEGNLPPDAGSAVLARIADP